MKLRVNINKDYRTDSMNYEKWKGKGVVALPDPFHWASSAQWHGDRAWSQAVDCQMGVEGRPSRWIHLHTPTGWSPARRHAAGQTDLEEGEALALLERRLAARDTKVRPHASLPPDSAGGTAGRNMGGGTHDGFKVIRYRLATFFPLV